MKGAAGGIGRELADGSRAVDAQHGNPVRRTAILDAHAASLAGWCWFGLSRE